jgi:HK97 family phage portal protein
VSLVRDFSSAFRILGLGGAINPISPHDDFWYSRPGYASDSGMRVSPESAMQLSAVFSCVRVCAETLGSMPLIIYKRLPDGGKERATDHPLYKVLHNKPNIYQTAMEWVEMMQGHVELRGNGFSLIIPGRKGAIDELIPLHPDRVNVYRLPNGRLRYQVRAWYDGTVQNYAMEEIFHVRGLSSDGMIGMSPIAVQREVIGTALAQQEYAARFFSNDSQPRGVLEHPGKLGDVAYKRIKDSWQESQTGVNRHKAALLEEGLKYQAIGMNNKDSQFLEARQFSRSDIAGFFRVPLHKIGDLSKSAFSNIEQQAIEFVTDNQRPRAVRWEQRISVDLLDPLELGDGNEYFAEFLMDGLLRGDIKSRYDAYSVGRTGGWLSRNDVRRFENLNPIKNGDDYLTPLNMGTTGGPGPDPNDQTANQTDATAVEARLRQFAIGAGERLVRKEIAALKRAAAKAKDPEDFEREAILFYASHIDLISETMRISRAEANSYCQDNLSRVSGAGASGASVEAELEAIALDGPGELVEKALVKVTRAKALAEVATGVKR